MPLALVAIGIVLLVAALRGTTGELFELIRGDFTGRGNFLVWIGAILGIGALGYVKVLQPIANALLVLLAVVLVLSNRGFFDQFTRAFKSTEQSR